MEGVAGGWGAMPTQPSSPIVAPSAVPGSPFGAFAAAPSVSSVGMQATAVAPGMHNFMGMSQVPQNQGGYFSQPFLMPSAPAGGFAQASFGGFNAMASDTTTFGPKVDDLMSRTMQGFSNLSLNQKASPSAAAGTTPNKNMDFLDFGFR